MNHNDKGNSVEPKATAESHPPTARHTAVREMSDDELRIRVAELCGWEDCKIATEIARVVGTTVVGTNDIQRKYADNRKAKGLPGWPYVAVPNYPADLNAMHEAEKVILSEKAEARYVKALENGIERPFHGSWSWVLLHATARQRAEALVLTLEGSPVSEAGKGLVASHSEPKANEAAELRQAQERSEQ